MTLLCRHISVAINRPASEIYHYVSQPENLPKWAEGLSGSIEKRGEEWIAQSPMGIVKIKFAAENEFGVLDHDVTTPEGHVFHNPMRVITNDSGSEVVFTLFRMPAISERDFEKDAAQILKDLKMLKSILEA